jgi:hypothetical protein
MITREEEIINRFKHSWVKTLNIYNDLINNHKGWDKVKPVRDFVQKLQRDGFDNHFRLGTSVYYLLISRSVEHGLRSDQKYIHVDPISPDDFKVTLKDGDKVYRQYRVATLMDEKVSKLLKTLSDTLID